MSIFSYSAQDAALMASLAEQAGQGLDNLNPPPGWSVARTFRDPWYGGQGYIVVGTLPSNGATVAVVALGSTWDDYTQNFTPPGFALTPVTVGLPASSNVSLASHALDLHKQLRTFARPLPSLDRPEQVRQALALPAAMQRNSEAFKRSMDNWLAAFDAPGHAVGQAHIAGQQLLGQVRQTLSAADPAQGAAALDRAVARAHDTLAAALSSIEGKVQAGYLTQWNGVQSAFVDALQQVARMQVFAKQFPVVFAGLAVGGPLAQLAAAYAAPGTRWSATQQSPVTDIAVYALSSPAFADAPFAAAFNAALPTAYTVNATGVDFFPSAPVQSGTTTLAPTGQLQSLSASMPAYDAPWAERTAFFYGQALGFNAQLKQPCCSDCDGADAVREYAGFAVQATPANYAPQTAGSLSVLCSLAYQRFQHPTSAVTPPSPWVYAADISANGVTWGAVFAQPGNGTVALAFRGTASEQELVERVADSLAYYPAWMSGAPSDAGVGRGIGTLYDALRGNLAAALQAGQAKLGASIGQLLLCGHDAGGNLACLAMLDLTMNPVSGQPAPSQAYAFGPPPFALMSFTRYFPTKVPANSVFLVARVADVVPQFSLNYTMYGVGQPVALTGGDADLYNGNSYHAISSYISLLNPGATPPRAAAKATLADLSVAASLPAPAHALFSRALAQRGIAPGQVVRGVLDSAATDDGVLRIAWSSRGRMASSLPSTGLDARRMNAHFAAEAIHVRPGHRLLLQADDGHALHLVAGRLLLEPGATVEVNARLVGHIGQVQGAAEDAPASTLYFVGVDGVDGMAGGDGPGGASGPVGTNGGTGGTGSAGGPGQAAQHAVVNVGVISGCLQVVAHGGVGGTGGRGGGGGTGGNSSGGVRGGSGGPGGAGGAGGAGGSGSMVDIYYEQMGPDGRVAVDAKPSSGGLGGAGGRGGLAGSGRPDGSTGTNGPSGPAGPSGSASVVTVRQRA